MSKEFKVPRLKAEIEKDYMNLCARAGDLQYKISRHEKDLESLNSQLQDLNLEFAASAKAEAEVKAVEATKVQAETNNVTPIASQEASNG